jgi:hypothetical protein
MREKGGRRSFSFLWSWPGEGRVRVLSSVGGRRLGVEIGLGLGFFFLYFFLVSQNCPPLYLCFETPIYRQKYCQVPKLGPSTFFFVNFDLSYFFVFFFSTSTRIRKISDFKNNALKVERVLKTFENLNSFETMLKILKIIQIY